MYPMMMALSLVGVAGGLNYFKKRMPITSQCCGIIGYVGQDPIAEDIVLDGIQILQYRGYDSRGICTINEDGNFIVHKKASGKGGD